MPKTQVAPDMVFNLRPHERIDILEKEPKHASIWFAVKVVSVEMPEGPVRETTEWGPTMQAGVVACEKVEGLWQWLCLSVNLKQIIGSLITDNNLDTDVWYYATITQLEGE